MNTEPAFAKCHCHHCSGGIEFPAESANQWIPCPHCGKETVLIISPGVLAKQGSNLRTCKDCGHQVSIHADTCPYCGAAFMRRSQHGVFYYVFWGVVSLGITAFILGVCLPALIVGIGIFSSARFKAQNDAKLKAIHTTDAGNTNVLAASTIALPTAAQEKTNYINQHLWLYELRSDYHDSTLHGRVPGVEFKLKNDGNRTLDKVVVTVFFKDRSGNVIAEEQFYPVHVTSYGSDDAPLKPGYIWQMERGHFYVAKNVPTEWKAGAAEFRITDIRFSDNAIP
jgi:predicted RNA-binding Zn-ribbon protein involved in translation (DUF1610 family)